MTPPPTEANKDQQQQLTKKRKVTFEDSFFTAKQAKMCYDKHNRTALKLIETSIKHVCRTQRYIRVGIQMKGADVLIVAKDSKNNINDGCILTKDDIEFIKSKEYKIVIDSNNNLLTISW
jgi:hypothetical protein